NQTRRDTPNVGDHRAAEVGPSSPPKHRFEYRRTKELSSGDRAGSCGPEPTFLSRHRLSKTSQSRLRITAVIEVHAHPVHDPQVEAAQLAVVVAGLEIIERSAGLQRASEAADGDHRHLLVVVLGARPHV